MICLEDGQDGNEEYILGLIASLYKATDDSSIRSSSMRSSLRRDEDGAT